MIENQKPESIWILAPLLFLVKIGVPSLYLLYMADPVVNSYLRLNINAQQWFWRYGYSGFCPSNMSSPLVIGVSTAPQLKIEEGIIIILNGYTPTISTGGGRFSVWIRGEPHKPLVTPEPRPPISIPIVYQPPYLPAPNPPVIFLED